MRLFKNKNIFTFLFAFVFWIIGGLVSNLFALPGYIHIAGFPEEAIVKLMPSFLHATLDNYI